MKVALSFPGCHRRGGVERVMLECAQFLVEQHHTVTVLANEWDAAALQGAHLHHVPMAKHAGFLSGYSFYRSCSRELALVDYDIHNSHGCICPTGGVFWVQSVQKAWLEQSARLRPPFSMSRWKQRLNPLHPLLISLEHHHFSQRNYKKLIATTPQVQADLQRFYGVPAEDVEVIPIGFSPREFNMERRQKRLEMRQRLGYRENDRVVIFVANELERKGFGPLLRSVAHLQDPSVHLLAVGRLSTQAYRAEIERLGLSQRVHFTGSSSDVAEFYAAADVFALPTQYEAWGLVIVEAMACGLPALTSRLAGASVAVREGENGFLLDNPADEDELTAKLRSLVQGHHLTPEAISASVSHYTWRNVLVDYERVLLEACSS